MLKQASGGKIKEFFQAFAVHTAEDGSDMFTHPHTDYLCERLSNSERSILLIQMARGIDFCHITESQVVDLFL